MSILSCNSVLLDGESVESKRQEIMTYFHNTYDLYERVFDLLKDESVFYKKSEITRHPMIFYYGHTATFFINKLVNMKIISERINASFESLFAVGVDEMAWDDMDGEHYRWPEVSAVKAYRDSVKEVVSNLIATVPLSLPIKEDSAMWIILMGIEHERIHIETSLVLHRQMPIELIKDDTDFLLCREHGRAVENSMVKIDAATVHLGVGEDPSCYSWDNEYGVYREDVAAFEVSKYLVSNEEFMEFVLAGGYEELEYWDEEGRRFLESRDVHYPTFWVKDGDSFKYRALSRIIEMPYSWPVDVNALEAEAYCRYKSKKDGTTYQLPSEAEHRVLYERADIDTKLSENPSLANQNFIHYSSSMPVDSFEFGGVYDVVGNVWQWSRTPIRPFDGFRIHEAYDDFSLPTFDEKHALILGSSWASSGNLITKNSRYAFRKHFYQNAGFRYVITDNKEKSVSDIYESDALVSQYCEFQYGEEHFGVENFAIATANIAKKYAQNFNKALDLGCATGRASYELAKEFAAVDGIDFSARFVGVGVRLKEQGVVAYETVREGELTTKKRVTMNELGYEEIKNRVSFWQGDACNLKANFSGYDLIMATNLIDRLYNPLLFLEDVGERLNSGGILVLTSPYTWQESSTKKEFWLGGYRDEEGREVETFESLKSILSKSFELIHREDIAFVIQETSRKYQHTIADVTLWRKC